MKVGADPKRLAFLGVLVLVGGYVIWTNLIAPSDSDSTPRVRPVASNSAVPSVAPASSDVDPSARRRNRQNRNDFDPPYRDPKRTIDPMKVDPTLRLDLLAKLQQVQIDPNTQRNLFQAGEAPAAPVAAGGKPLPAVKPIVHESYDYPKLQKPPAPPVPPPPPPITLKYYGYATPRATGRKRAFFLDGEEIIVAAEGELIKRRYRLVKIGVNSVTMEDTQFKHEQVLPLTEDLAG